MLIISNPQNIKKLEIEVVFCWFVLLFVRLYGKIYTWYYKRGDGLGQ